MQAVTLQAKPYGDIMVPILTTEKGTEARQGAVNGKRGVSVWRTPWPTLCRLLSGASAVADCFTAWGCSFCEAMHLCNMLYNIVHMQVSC